MIEKKFRRKAGKWYFNVKYTIFPSLDTNRMIITLSKGRLTTDINDEPQGYLVSRVKQFTINSIDEYHKAMNTIKLNYKALTPKIERNIRELGYLAFKDLPKAYFLLI